MSNDLMPEDLDGRLDRALHELVSNAPTDGVFELVATKRRRRQSVRRARVASVSLVCALAFVGTAVWVGRDDDGSTVATRGSVSSVHVVRGIAPAAAPGRSMPLRAVPVRPDEGYLTSPLHAGGTTVALAAYERTDGGYSFPPSHVVRVQANGRVVDRIDLQGEILELAEGEGARWALTHDKEVIGPQDPEFRIKRIGPDGSVVSNPVPPGDVPTGDLVAGGGGVWLPVRDAVLRFDAVTGAFAARIPLDVPAERRGIANLGKFVAVTDGTSVLRLDPSTDTASSAIGSGPEQLIDLAGNANTVWMLGAPRVPGGRPVLRAFVLGAADVSQLRLPADLEDPRLDTANGVAWITAERAGATVAMRLAPDRARVERSVTLGRGEDVAFTFLDRARVVIVADGLLHRTRVG